MGARYEDKFVVCPFYRRHEGKMIICEGVSDNSTTHIAFEFYDEKKKHMHDFCYDVFGCRDCPLYRMLDIIKYGGDYD